jgi:mannosyltransferase OCH1-like enzyme
MIVKSIEEIEFIRNTRGLQRGEVPKIIHQTWKDNNIPDHWLPSHTSWIELHPDWIYVLWTDEMNLKLIETYYPEFLYRYNGYRYNIQRADSIRPFILKRYGGMYVDLDIECVYPVDEYIESGSDVILLKDFGNLATLMERNKDNFIGRYIENSGRYTNMIMASVPESPFWDLVIDEMLKPHVPWWSLSRHFYIMHTTGPFVIDRCVTQYEREYINKPQRSIDNIHNVTLFPHRNFNPCTVCDSKPCTIEGSNVRMLEGSSWAHIDSKVITWVSCHPISILFYIILILVLVFGLYMILRNRGKYNKR